MPRLESITVSHSILSLTCDRNKAVLKATCSAAAPRGGCEAPAPCEDRDRDPSHRHLPGTMGLLGPKQILITLLTFSRYFTAIFSSSRKVGLCYFYCTVNTKRVM